MNSPLALLGGDAAIRQPGPHFSWPPITDRSQKVVAEQLAESISIYDRSGVIAELEDALANYFGVKHAVLMSSGTAALHAAYAACVIEPGDEVIVPAYTFFATATPLLHLGAIPVLADCDETGNISVTEVAAKITPNTAAIVATHMWGIPANVPALRALAQEHHLALIEDGSHAHGASLDGQKVGSFGKAAAFSMNGPKPLSAGEGGFVLTNDDEVFYRTLMFAHYNKRCRSEIPPTSALHRFAVTGTGLKFRIHPLAASFALDQLAHLDEYLAGRAEIAKLMCDELKEVAGISVPQLPSKHQAAWYGLPLTYVPDELGGLPVERFHQALLAEGLKEVDQPGSTRPLNQLPLIQDPAALFPFQPEFERVQYWPGQFPVAETVHHHTLKLPVWHREEDVPLARAYVSGIKKVVEHHHDLKG
ncbi:DegT/DnrJ/EryC1/StrS family aminotransferase [Lentzea sp. BCCO 10_0856]|uniref:DegT/DnrJ/EryC1/StrS family aminotransferase n=1 Tax=Lentzea miocenica TaxID=3095431 RepID=A0ABU4SU23_9PSEU|nr:DegT/DnrJ/EryC1/StrS family aminotransferase [Lentzea sp. BCCO 10_0856]MDX8029376.1 DegT/DnrJ/EryC1/StrS family aminotransferase [Lentzea sp. BCCO 10_0856]